MDEMPVSIRSSGISRRDDAEDDRGKSPETIPLSGKTFLSAYAICSCTGRPLTLPPRIIIVFELLPIKLVLLPIAKMDLDE
jgi:hypothetical protein